MKINLLDESDLKAIEECLFKAITRAVRVLSEDPLVKRYLQRAAAPAPPPQPVADLRSYEPKPPPAPTPLRAVMPTTPAKPERRKQRSAGRVAKTVADRPDGYITTDEARKIIGDGPAAATALSQWVLGEEIPAVIVTSIKPPTKGLVGRLHVMKEAVLRRNEERQRNIASMPALKARAANIAKRRNGGA